MSEVEAVAAQSPAMEAPCGDEGALAPATGREAVVGEQVVGEQVEYCLRDGFGAGEWRPAIVVRAHVNGDLNLVVFTDGSNDYLPCPLWVERVLRGTAQGCWRPKGTA